jgi:hypothetical protein
VPALIFDPFAGISGDMTVAALIDLGLEESWLREFVASLGLGDIRIDVARLNRQGIDCAHVAFYPPHEHVHRHLRDVLEIIERAAVPAAVKDRTAAVFHRLAAAEAKVHGTTPDRVHFHEVGALDSILDVLCAVAGIERLGFTAFYTQPVAVGHGWVNGEHGRIPVPAPATLELLAGIPLASFDLEGECTTPTGAAILAALTNGCAPPPGLIARRTGFGAGTRDPHDRPNFLRLIGCEPATEVSNLYIVQTDVDDLAPEYLPPVQEALFAAGAVDVTVTALTMKKGRPGLRIESLVPAARLDAAIDALFQNTPTIGARYWTVQRCALGREEQTIEWRGQTIRRKRVTLPGGGYRFKPEYDDVVRAARALDLPPYQVRLALDADDATN